ncbi:LysR substrate-binding domain-containing protein [Rhizobacter sp. Root1221]|uniref:LysR substrate-binding domain-containing protein n=1 Tax=Rhizobacter sp. Root1221 TaxID=1736433 RepID=UPI000700FE01|nr:LysR substrate-binding domain-containing protein [Rhizobacter sp. Root1221]KQW01389.1 LysR family transcriptional regulator [Rhizobacter sp. Root1221]
MRRKIPSTTALSVFESAARHRSFTLAAVEQAMTQSAVSRQVAALESFLGVKLFRRTKRGVVLTEAGRHYSEQVGARLEGIERDTLELMASRGQGGSLEIAVVPTFATKWLLPRLGAFQRQHEGTFVHLTPRTRPFLFDGTPFDAAIYAGEARWPGTDVHFLMRENPIAVASPDLIAPRHVLKANELGRLPLLQQSTRPYAWRHWFDSLGVQSPNDMAGPRYELFSMLTEAAIHGLGVALIPRFMVEDELERGRLVQVVRHDYLSDRAYHLAYPQQRSERPLLAAFRTWLEAEATRYREANGLG